MKAKIVYLALVLALVFSLAAAIVPAMPVSADTNVNGNQSGTWSLALSPYIVTGDVTVPSGQTLTIQPGVNVKFDLGTSLYVDGTLTAEGASGSNIVFTSNAGTPAAGDWWRIQFNTGSAGSVKYCDIAYGTIPIYLNSVSGSAGNPAVTIENCNIHDSGYTLINLLTSDYNTIKGNTLTLIDIGQAIYLDSSSHNLVENNTCTSLGTHGTGIRLVANFGSYSGTVVRGNTVHDMALGITINTAEGMNATDILIEGNTCYDNTNGIGLESSYGGVAQDITVTGNTLYNHSSSTIFSRTWRWPAWVDPHPWGTFSNVNITGNDITATRGVTIGYAFDPDVGYVEGESDVTGFHVNYNNIVGSTDWLAKNVGDGTLDAENNWWGTAVGSEIAALVDGDVDYDPWLGEPYPPAAEEGGCFIATAAYGTSTAAEIDVLRVFRDEVLLESTLGSQLVEWYYQTSPPVADFISEHDVLRTLVRELLVDPVVWVVDAVWAVDAIWVVDVNWVVDAIETLLRG